LYADPTNSGDYASHLGIKQLVGRPGVELFGAPIALRKTLNILRQGPQGAAPWHAVVVGGGSFLQSCFDDMWDGLISLDVPLVLFGIGAAEEPPARLVTSAERMRRIGAVSKSIHVRDDFTRELFAAAGVDGVTTGICPAVNYLHPCATASKTRATHLLHVVHDVDLALADVSGQALRSKARELAAQLGLEYEETRHMESVQSRLLARYARAAVVLSSRLHGCIFSYASGRPFVAIVCDSKLNAFLDTHVPQAPRVEVKTAMASLSAATLKAAMAAPIPDPADAIAANVVRMREILAEL
jgi:hypothetical protein